MAGVAGLLGLLTATVAAETSPTLSVRLYNSSGASAADVLAASRVAAPILREAGVHVAFRMCASLRHGDDTPDPCAEPLRDSEIVVRVIPSPRHSTLVSDHAFGVAYVIKASNRGWLATVYADRVATAASRVALEPGTLLGRVMAHEVGHLLLGTDYHSHTGLMRAEWTDALLHQGPSAWRFSGPEHEAMQRALAGEAPWAGPSTR